MSISHEALQNTQLTDDVKKHASLSEEEMTLDDWIDVTIALTIALLLAAIMVAHYPQFQTKSTRPMKTMQASTKVSTKPVVASTHIEVPQQIAKPSLPVKQENVTQEIKQELTVSYVPEDMTKSKIIKTPPEDVIDEAEYKSKHILNGVFVSDNEKVAMINNRFFNIGDEVDGLKIVDIQVDKIKLEQGKNKIELRIVV